MFMHLPKAVVSFCLSLTLLSFLPETAVADSLPGAGETIVVIDPDGVAVKHPDLSDHVVQEVCVTFANLCPDGTNSEVGYGAAAPSFNSDGSFKSGSGTHGTEVASVAVGKTVGLAPGANLIAIHAPTDLYLAFKWVVDHVSQYKIAAIVLSVGQARNPTKRGQLPCDQIYASSVGSQYFYIGPLITQLRSMGIATVVASGNDGELHDLAYPACLSGVVSVGAVTKGTLTLDGYTNVSPELNLLAPSLVRAAKVGAAESYGYSDNVQGTSVAAPYVAGAIAILRATYPSLTVDDEVAVLRTTGTPIDDVAVKGIPIINVAAALAFLASGKQIPSLESTFTVQRASGVQISAGDSTSLINSANLEIVNLSSQIQTMKDQDALMNSQIYKLQYDNRVLTAELASAATNLALASNFKMSTITCFKGASVWKISGVKPICPTGYRKK